ncbi:MAG: TadE/TadG family type IV pilus assembly protein [Actinomycetota bacterium]
MLKSASDEEGSAPVEVTFAVVVLMLLSLGVIQVGLTLYARNVVLSAAHEGARAAVELDRRTSDASEAARRLVERAAGGIVDDLQVSTSTIEAGDRLVTHVMVSGLLDVPGPIPVSIPVRTAATASREGGVE